MATNSNHASGRNTNRKATGKKKSNQNLKIVIFIVEILIIIAMLFVVWQVWQGTEEDYKQHEGMTQEEAGVNQAIQDATNNKNNSDNQTNQNTNSGDSNEVTTIPKVVDYWNIALFGLDAVNEDQLYKGSRSDSIMIASIHKETGEIKLVSVYRDTFLNLSNDKYTKCNAAYSYGGADQAIAMLNMNMDLNITDFVAVGYPALMDCIDALGGVWIEVDKEELKHINNYQQSIIRDVDGITDKDYVKVTETGYQLLNGLQASAYCRIRQTLGDDFKRAERQREVIKAMVAQAQKADLDTLTDVVTAVAPNVYTTFAVKDMTVMTELLKNIGNYKIVDEGGFPTEELRTTASVAGEGSCVIPLNLEKNVVWLHGFLFGEENYQVSDEVKECSDTVKAKTQKYIDVIN